MNMKPMVLMAESPARRQVSALDRLKSLPDLFRGGDLTLRFGWSSKRASHYLYLWKKRGLVDGLGGHSDVFAKLYTEQSPNWLAAAEMAMPGSVVLGLDVLRRHGWITQVPNKVSVLPGAGGGRYKIDRFDIVERPASWLSRFAPGIVRSDSLSPAELAPEWALVDLIEHEGWGHCGIHHDDVDWDEINPQTLARASEVASSLGVDLNLPDHSFSPRG